jgi:hypothetical protein
METGQRTITVEAYRRAMMNNYGQLTEKDLRATFKDYERFNWYRAEAVTTYAGYAVSYLREVRNETSANG